MGLTKRVEEREGRKKRQTVELKVVDFEVLKRVEEGDDVLCNFGRGEKQIVDKGNVEGRRVASHCKTIEDVYDVVEVDSKAVELGLLSLLDEDGEVSSIVDQ